MHQNRIIMSLTQYQNKLRKNYRKLGIFLENKTDKQIFVFRPTPNCPWLPESRKKYYGKLIKRLKGIKYSKKYTFATLTYWDKKYTPTEASAQIKHHIDLFFKRLGYYNKKPEYFYIIELTDKMMPHIHIIFDRFIHWRKLRKSWLAVTGNSVTHIKHLSQKTAFFYCLKYLNDSKKQDFFKWEFIFKNIGRIWTSSRNFFAKLPPTESLWNFLFSAFDPDGNLDISFEDAQKDLISNEIPLFDAVHICGFLHSQINLHLLNISKSFRMFNVSTQTVLNKIFIPKPDNCELLINFGG